MYVYLAPIYMYIYITYMIYDVCVRCMYIYVCMMYVQHVFPAHTLVKSYVDKRVCVCGVWIYI